MQCEVATDRELDAFADYTGSFSPRMKAFVIAEPSLPDKARIPSAVDCERTELGLKSAFSGRPLISQHVRVCFKRECATPLGDACTHEQNTSVCCLR